MGVINMNFYQQVEQFIFSLDTTYKITISPNAPGNLIHPLCHILKTNTPSTVFPRFDDLFAEKQSPLLRTFRSSVGAPARFPAVTAQTRHDEKGFQSLLPSAKADEFKCALPFRLCLLFGEDHSLCRFASSHPRTPGVGKEGGRPERMLSQDWEDNEVIFFSSCTSKMFA